MGTADPDGWQPHGRGQREGGDIVVWHRLGVEPVLGKKRDFSVLGLCVKQGLVGSAQTEHLPS